MEIRIGHGYDVHRLKAGRKLILGGVQIPHHLGLHGHSDADVLTHAIIDALLGALALGDIGQHFPDTDEQYRGISSTTLLSHVAQLIARAGYALGNLDATIIAQEPKLAPYMSEMRQILADKLSADLTQISVKATTEEGLGFTGEQAGVAAHAVVLLRRI